MVQCNIGSMSSYLICLFYFFSDDEGYVWAWIPPLAGFLGAVIGSILYQVMSGNHVPDDVIECDEYGSSDLGSHHVSRNPSRSSASMDSIKTLTTTIDSW